MYSALLQMVRLILRERTLDCSCKRRHAQKYASVLSDIMKWHTEWISSIVVITKKDSKLRICLDPKDLNRAILVD